MIGRVVACHPKSDGYSRLSVALPNDVRVGAIIVSGQGLRVNQRVELEQDEDGDWHVVDFAPTKGA